MKNNPIFLALLCLLLSIPTITQAQKNRQIVIDIKESYDKFYARTDSLHKSQPNFTFNDTIVNDLKNTDTTEPYNFFWTAMDKYEYELGKFDEAAIYYYVGLIRYHYYLGVNPGYPPSGGWVTTESLRQRVTQRIELYLQTNIDKYIKVLRYAINYCNNNNYNYWTKPKDDIMYKKAVEPYEILLKDLETNKEKYVQLWLEDRIRKLNPANLSRDEVRKKMEEHLAEKVNELLKTKKERENIIKKIAEEKLNPNSKTLQDYQKKLEDLDNKSSSVSLIDLKKQIINQEIEDLKVANDTTKTLYAKGEKPINIDSAKSKEDIYTYYESQKWINHYKYIKSKEKIAILNYINKMPWIESIKLEILKLVQYDDTLKTSDKSKDIYLSKVDKKKAELDEWQQIADLKGKKQSALKQIKVLLGEAEGKKVWDDIECIIEYHKNQYTAH